MRPLRSYIAGALAVSLAPAWGCATLDETADFEEHAPEEEGGADDLDVVYQNIDALVGSCTFAAGVLTVTSTAAQTIIIGKRAVDSAILVNAATCVSAAPVVTASSSKTKRLVIRGSAADESVILDFTGGLFAPGVANAMAGGIAIDLGTGTDGVSIQATPSTDSFYIGADGLAFNSDRYKDITFAGVETLSLVLGVGNDVLTATNAVPTRGVTGAATIPLTIFGGAGNDVIVGGSALDTIYGGIGNDTLAGGASNDVLYGEAGADIMQGTALTDGDDTIDCGDESPTNTSIDVVSYDKRTQVITATMGAPGTAGQSGESDTINANCEGITGGLGNDTLTGNGTANTLSGGPGNDRLIGKGGADVLNGGTGDDTFDEEASGTGGDTFVGGLGTDTIDYGARGADLTVTMDGSGADDGASGEADDIKADVENILCGSGNDRVIGNTLANTITGGAGNDDLNGAAGNDTFLEEASPNGTDIITGGLGIDLVDYRMRSADLTVTMSDDVANDGESGENDNVKSDVENLKAGSGNDTLTGNALANLIEGGNGNDTLSGGEGDDTLDGSDRGSSVNDISCGGGADVALNKGAGSYASDCELKGN